MAYRFLEAVSSGAAVAHAFASREINQVESAFNCLTSDAVASSDEQLEHAVRPGGALVASCGGGGAGV